MEKSLDLNYLEDVITYSCLRGDNKDIICPVVIEYVKDGVFNNPRNLMLLDITKEFYIENARIPELSEVKMFIKGDDDSKMFTDFIHLCRSFDKNLNIERGFLIKKIEDFLKQRTLSNIIDDTYLKRASDKPVSIEEVLKELEDAMSIYLMDDIGLNLFSNYKEYVDVLMAEDNRISTGYTWLDEMLGGGLLSKGSALYNFCAASNVGKSNFIKSLAGNMSKCGKNVLVVSLEMSRYIYANRFVSDLAGYPLQKLKDHENGIIKFLSGAKSEGYGDILIKDFATGSITPQALMSYIRRVQASLGIKFDVIFIDYPELLKPSRIYSGRHDLTIAQQYVETRAISYVLETPIVSVAQLNRDAYNKTNPSMESIGNAIGIMQCSDFGGFLFSDDEMKELNQLGLNVGKNRFGPVNRSHRYNVCPDTLKITEASTEYKSPEELETENETHYITEDEDDFGDIFDD